METTTRKGGFSCLVCPTEEDWTHSAIYSWGSHPNGKCGRLVDGPTKIGECLDLRVFVLHPGNTPTGNWPRLGTCLNHSGSFPKGVIPAYNTKTVRLDSFDFVNLAHPRILDRQTGSGPSTSGRTGIEGRSPLAWAGTRCQNNRRTCFCRPKTHDHLGMLPSYRLSYSPPRAKSIWGSYKWVQTKIPPPPTNLAEHCGVVWGGVGWVGLGWVGGWVVGGLAHAQLGLAGQRPTHSLAMSERKPAL